MTRAERIVDSIKKAQAEGMEFLGKGMGDYTEAFNNKRAEGYVVGCWYTSITKEGRQWIMYGRKKLQSTQKVEEPKVNYEEKTVKELKELCKMQKVVGYSKMNKQQMVESLSKAC